MRSTVSQEQEDQILSLFKTGQTAVQISRQVGVPYFPVYSRGIKAGFVRPVQRGPNARSAGRSQAVVRPAPGIDEDMKAAVPSTALGARVPYGTRGPQITAMLAEGKPVAEISRLLGLPYSAIHGYQTGMKQAAGDPVTRHVPQKTQHMSALTALLLVANGGKRTHLWAYEAFGSQKGSAEPGDVTRTLWGLGYHTVSQNWVREDAENHYLAVTGREYLGKTKRYDLVDLDAYGWTEVFELLDMVFHRLKDCAALAFTIPIPNKTMSCYNADQRASIDFIMGLGGRPYTSDDVVQYVKHLARRYHYDVVSATDVVAMDTVWRFGFVCQAKTIKELRGACA